VEGVKAGNRFGVHQDTFFFDSFYPLLFCLFHCDRKISALLKPEIVLAASGETAITAVLIPSGKSESLE